MSDRRRPLPAVRCAVLAASLFSLIPVAARGDDPECVRLCREGNDHIRAHEYEAGVDCYRRAVEADPKSSRAQNMLGTGLARLADATNEQKATLDQAIAAWEKVLTMEAPDPLDAAMVNVNLGDVSADRKKDPEKVLAYYKAAVVAKPDYGEAWRKLARFQNKQKMFREALDSAKKALDCGDLTEKGTKEMKSLVELCPKELENPVAQSAAFAASFPLPSAGGLATTGDLATLVVSVPTAAQLVYFDTIASKETKRISLEVQPGRLAVQGKTLYVAARGTAKLLALDLDSGKVEKTIKLPSPLIELSCHRSKGLLYGTTTAGEVVSIDPASGRAVTCQAKGAFLAIDPSKPSTVYTAGPSAGAKNQPEGTTVLRKYAVNGSDLKLVETNEDAAVRGRGLDVAPDGKCVAVFGEGGFHDATGDLKPGTIAVFETGTVKTAAGQLDVKGSPRCLAFHPWIEVGVAVTDKAIAQFHARSLVHLHDWPLSPGVETKEPRLVAFVDGGKKLARWEPGDGKNDGSLGLLPLVLGDDDKAALEKALAGAAKSR